jgi:hypothetical protein
MEPAPSAPDLKVMGMHEMSVRTIFMTVIVAFVTELVGKCTRLHQQQCRQQTCDDVKRFEHVLFLPANY